MAAAPSSVIGKRQQRENHLSNGEYFADPAEFRQRRWNEEQTEQCCAEEETAAAVDVSGTGCLWHGVS
jgi:hypothetical protein